MIKYPLSLSLLGDLLLLLDLELLGDFLGTKKEKRNKKTD